MIAARLAAPLGHRRIRRGCAAGGPAVLPTATAGPCPTSSWCLPAARTRAPASDLGRSGLADTLRPQLGNRSLGVSGQLSGHLRLPDRRRRRHRRDQPHRRDGGRLPEHAHRAGGYRRAPRWSTCWSGSPAGQPGRRDRLWPHPSRQPGGQRGGGGCSATRRRSSGNPVVAGGSAGVCRSIDMCPTATRFVRAAGTCLRTPITRLA